jgi:hypothetical protein
VLPPTTRVSREIRACISATPPRSPGRLVPDDAAAIWSKDKSAYRTAEAMDGFGRYDSAREYSDERTKMMRVQSMALLSDLAEGVSDANRPSLSLDFKHAQCIASDDPRLKKK